MLQSEEFIRSIAQDQTLVTLDEVAEARLATEGGDIASVSLGNTPSPLAGHDHPTASGPTGEPRLTTAAKPGGGQSS